MEEELEEGEGKFCPVCGRMLSSEVEYCPVCGVRYEVRQTRLGTAKSRLLRVGHGLVFVAGFIGLFCWFLNFGSALAASLANPMMALIFLIIALLSLVAWGCGWTAGRSRWRKGSLKWTAVQIAFVAFYGLLNLIMGIKFWGATGFGYAAFLATGSLMVIFSLAGLILTAFV